MVILKRVIPTDRDVVALINALNDYQVGLYGVENCNLESPETMVTNNAYMIGAFSQGTIAGIGAVKIIDTYAEIKRMFVKEPFRGLSIARQILHALETHVHSKGISSICLETGNLHHAAINFYKQNGYQQIDSFGDYLPNAVSLYFQKEIED